MKKSTLALVGVAAVGAFFLMRGAGSSSALVDIGDGDYLPSEGGLSFLVGWAEPLDLEARARLMEIMSFRSRGISGNYEVIEINPDTLTGGTVDESEPDWHHVLQQDILNQINGWSEGAISFADVYEA